MPLNIVLSSDGKYAVTSSSSLVSRLCCLRTSDGRIVSSINYTTMGAADPNDGLFYGLVFAPDNTLYAAKGVDGKIAVIKMSPDGTLTQTGTIAAQQANDGPTGLALDAKKRLYITNYLNVTAPAASSLSIYDTTAGAYVGRFTFQASFGGSPCYPWAVTVKSDGSKAYVASERDGCVYVLDTTDPTSPTLKTTITSGSHPDALLLNRAQDRLFIANGQSDTISMVDTSTDTVLTTVLLRPPNVRNLAGVGPTGLALSADEKTLYASLGDFNAVAVIDTKKGQLNGYIPAGWYPTAIAAPPNDNNLLVVNGWGTTARNPNPGFNYLDPNVMLPNPQNPTVLTSPGPGYDLNSIPGNVSRIDVAPALARLDQSSVQVVANNQEASGATTAAAEVVSGMGLRSGKLKHVIYIIKENRSYDQMLGDIGKGNSDPSLTIFGQPVTPNLHALANRFTLADNYYNNAPVSGEGWTWCTQGQANEYVVKNIPYVYRIGLTQNSLNYNCEGQNSGFYLTGGFPAKDPDGNTLSVAFPNGMPAIPNVAEAGGGYIWDAVKAAGLTYRNWGFFLSTGVAAPTPTPVPGASPAPPRWIIPDNYPTVTNLQPPGHDLAGNTDIDFRKFDFSYADSDAWTKCGGPFNKGDTVAYGKYDMPSRFSEWNREFQLMLKQDATGASVPTFMMVRFMRNHTVGLDPGFSSPRAMVADNDYAVGQLVDAVSKSPIWESTVIFVIEDDAQFGPDHVDAHRSPILVISPWIKQGTLDSNFYNSDSVLRSIELLLGLAPMTQYDALAAPISGGWDSAPNNAAPYDALLPARSIISEVNPPLSSYGPKDPRRRLAILSSRMNFKVADAAPAHLLNEITWKSVRGPNAKMPAPRIHRLPCLDKASGRRSEDEDDD